MWFVIVVAALAGLPRVLLSRRFAELQHAKLRQPISVKRARWMALLIIPVVVFLTGLYFSRWGHQGWIVVAILFSVLSAAEFFFQARYSGIESLMFQNRLLGILYLGLAAGAYILLSRV